jgi:hypothetical protein
MSGELIPREEQTAQAIALRLRGYSIRAIGRKLGVPFPTVQNWLEDSDRVTTAALSEMKHRRLSLRIADVMEDTVEEIERKATPETLEAMTLTELLTFLNRMSIPGGISTDKVIAFERNSNQRQADSARSSDLHTLMEFVRAQNALGNRIEIQEPAIEGEAREVE